MGTVDGHHHAHAPECCLHPTAKSPPGSVSLSRAAFLKCKKRPNSSSQRALAATSRPSLLVAHRELAPPVADPQISKGLGLLQVAAFSRRAGVEEAQPSRERNAARLTFRATA